MSNKPFTDKRWRDNSLEGVKFDNSKVTSEQKKKTEEFHELFKKTFAKQLKEKHSHKYFPSDGYNADAKYCYENGINPDPNILNADTFNISKVQFVNTLQMLSDHGYISGVRFTSAKIEGIVISGLHNASITVEGLQYLAENTMMKKAYKIFKEFRDWLPGY